MYNQELYPCDTISTFATRIDFNYGCIISFITFRRFFIQSFEEKQMSFCQYTYPVFDFFPPNIKICIKMALKENQKVHYVLFLNFNNYQV